MQVIQTLAPSFNFPRPTIADGTDSIRPATLRGLGPDHVLVLINGKRRHTTALIHINGTIGRGSTGVDLNAIPRHRHREDRDPARRRGRAVRLGRHRGRHQHRPQVRRRPADRGRQGRRSTRAASPRSSAPSRTSATARRWTWARAGAATSAGAPSPWPRSSGTARAPTGPGADPRDQVVAGDANNNPVPQPNMHWGDSEATDVMAFLNGQMPVNASGDHVPLRLRRLEPADGLARRQLPPGPGRQQLAADLSARLPAPHRAARSSTPRGPWACAARAGSGSGTFPRSTATTGWTIDVAESLNASLGPSAPPNHPDFYAGASAFNQVVANLDLSRKVDLGAGQARERGRRRGGALRELRDRGRGARLLASTEAR